MVENLDFQHGTSWNSIVSLCVLHEIITSYGKIHLHRSLERKFALCVNSHVNSNFWACLTFTAFWYFCFFSLPSSPKFAKKQGAGLRIRSWLKKHLEKKDLECIPPSATVKLSSDRTGCCFWKIIYHLRDDCFKVATLFNDQSSRYEVATVLISKSWVMVVKYARMLLCLFVGEMLVSVLLMVQKSKANHQLDV